MRALPRSRPTPAEVAGSVAANSTCPKSLWRMNEIVSSILAPWYSAATTGSMPTSVNPARRSNPSMVEGSASENAANPPEVLIELRWWNVLECRRHGDHEAGLLGDVLPAGEGEPASRPKRRPEVAERLRGVAEEHDPELADHSVERVVTQVSVLGVDPAKRDVGHIGGAGFGYLQHRSRDVDANNRAGRACGAAQLAGQCPKAAADLEDPLRGLGCGSGKKPLGEGRVHPCVAVLLCRPEVAHLAVPDLDHPLVVVHVILVLSMGDRPGAPLRGSTRFGIVGDGVDRQGLFGPVPAPAALRPLVQFAH